MSGDLAEWYASQYDKAVGLSAAEGGARYKGFLGGFPSSVAVGNGEPIFPFTGRRRMRRFVDLKMRFPLSGAGYVCLVLTARMGAAVANYAYAYWRRGREGGDPEYICVGPTYESRDGEFRRGFMRFDQFGEQLQMLSDKASSLEAAVAELVGAGAVETWTAAYPSSANDELAGRARALRLPITGLVLVFLYDRDRFRMAHTNKAYGALIDAIAGAHPALGPGPKLGAPPVGRPIFLCGQKLVPMTVREVAQVSDFHLAAWRELAVTRAAGDLVLNYITPSFAIYNQWTYVEGAGAPLFDNAPMKERYARSRAVERTARLVREARRTLVPVVAPSAAPSAAPGAAPLNNIHTEALGAQLYESLEYAQSFLLMSTVAILHTMEDVGVTLASLPLVPPAKRASMDLSAGSGARFLFEYAYAAHCLHTKLGVAHTDLHSNNLTAYPWGGHAAGRMYDDPVVAYVAGPRGEADTYVFPAAGTSGCIIDYSRAILGPDFRPRLEAGRSASYADAIYRDQAARVLRALYRYAPTYVEKHQAAIRAAVLANFEAVFPVLCAVDYVAIGRAGGVLCEAGAPPAVAELAARLEAAAQEALVTGLHDLVEARGAAARPPAFPGPALFQAVFGAWHFPRWAAAEPRRLKTAQLVDAYNYNNGLRYSGDDYARFQPWARLDEIEPHLGELRLADLFGPGLEAFHEALQPGARAEVLAEQLRAEQEKLDGVAPPPGSSWLDE